MTVFQQVTTMAKTDGILVQAVSDKPNMAILRNDKGCVAVTVSGLEKIQNDEETISALVKSRYERAKSTLLRGE